MIEDAMKRKKMFFSLVMHSLLNTGIYCIEEKAVCSLDVFLHSKVHSISDPNRLKEAARFGLSFYVKGDQKVKEKSV